MPWNGLFFFSISEVLHSSLCCPGSIVSLYFHCIQFCIQFSLYFLLSFTLILKTEALKNVLKILNANNKKDDKNAPAQEWSVLRLLSFIACMHDALCKLVSFLPLYNLFYSALSGPFMLLAQWSPGYDSSVVTLPWHSTELLDQSTGNWALSSSI